MAQSGVTTCRVNVLLSLAYCVLVMCVDANGQITRLGSAWSRVLICGLLGAGVGASLFSLVKEPRRWQIPVVCLLVYLILSL